MTIAQRYRQDYPDEPVPPPRTIGRMHKELGLSRTLKKRVKDAARYLCYPEHTVYETLDARLLEADFIGQKYLAGRRVVDDRALEYFAIKDRPVVRHSPPSVTESAASARFRLPPDQSFTELPG